MSTQGALSKLVEAVRDRGLDEIVKDMDPVTKKCRDKLCEILPPITDRRRCLKREHRSMVSAPAPRDEEVSSPLVSNSRFVRKRKYDDNGDVVTEVTCNGVLVASSVSGASGR